MKISSTYLFDSSLKNIQSTQSDVSRSRERIASGKALTRASDDTSKLRNIETLQSSLKKIDSFDSNLFYLKDRLKLEESVLSSASDILIRLKELAIQAANDTLSGTDRDIIAAAEQAGCAKVLPRSKFFRDFDSLVNSVLKLK